MQPRVIWTPMGPIPVPFGLFAGQGQQAAPAPARPAARPAPAAPVAPAFGGFLNSPYLLGNPNQPQGGNEPDLTYWLRRAVGMADPRNVAEAYHQRWTEPVMETLTTPNQRAARAQPQQRQAQGNDAAERAAAQRRLDAMLQPAQAFAPQQGPLFQTQGWRHTSGIGDPRDGGRRRHMGDDWAPSSGDPAIRATQPFEVIGFRQAGLGGNTARVRFADGRVADFMHLAGPVPVGTRGGPGDIIGVAGRSGNATGTSTHVQMVQGSAGGGGAGPGTAPGMEPWNQYAGMALGELDRAEALAMQPVQISRTVPAPPALPAPAHFAAPDFSAGNAAFEQARPRHPFEEKGSETRLLRENFFRGMAEGLLSINPHQPIGFGALLLRAGAGALGGRMAGAEQVRQRMDRYDGLMQRYNEALAGRNDQQAQSAANTINQNIQLDNEHARAQASLNIQEHYRNNSVEVNGSNVITRSRQGDQQVIDITPIPSMVAQSFANNRAQIFLQGAGPAQQNAQWAYQTARTEALQWAALGVPQGGATGTQSLNYLLSETVVPMVEAGTIQQVIGPQSYQQLRAEFEAQNPIDPQQMALQPQLLRDREARWNEYLANQVVLQANSDPRIAERILTSGQGAAAQAVQRARTQRTSVRRSRSGVSTTQTYDSVE